MKKVISLLSAITMIAVTLAGCGGKADKFAGTWKTDSIEVDGTKYTVSELEAIGADHMSEAQIVIKEGGKAYVAVGDDGEIVDWTKTETGVKIGKQEYTIVGGMMCLENGKTKVYFQKISDSQTIGDAQLDDTKSESDTDAPDGLSVATKDSPDKYTWYIKSYVGKNCASIGYTSMGGDRMDKYGAGLLELIFVTPDGTYVHLESKNDLKQYVVTGQSIAPNTELKLTFDKDSEGNEYDNLVATQTYEEIVLSVKKVNSSDKDTVALTAIDPSPDKYTWYISDYTGRNLATCGYTSLSGDLMDKYGAAVVKLVIISEDGSFIDPEDAESLKNYVVTGQNVSPNSELKLVFDTDSDGNEYDNLVESQNIEEIELTVNPVGNI